MVFVNCCYLSALLGFGRSKLLEDCLDLDLLLAKYEIFVNDRLICQFFLYLCRFPSFLPGLRASVNLVNNHFETPISYSLGAMFVASRKKMFIWENIDRF